MHVIATIYSKNTSVSVHVHRYSPAGMLVLAFLPHTNPKQTDKVGEQRFLLKYALTRLKAFFQGLRPVSLDLSLST